ncbi:MAG TPA: NAD(P)H-dependent oxidoreductase, partial [Porticoccaceae bacterium]
MIDNLPNVAGELFDRSIPARLNLAEGEHKPRILLLYGSNRERSYSRLLTEEAARLLEAFGAESRIFNPSGLPMPDDAD